MTNPTLALTVFILVFGVGKVLIEVRLRMHDKTRIAEAKERQNDAVRRLGHEVARHHG